MELKEKGGSKKKTCEREDIGNRVEGKERKEAELEDEIY